MNVGSLFSGIGGLDLGLERAGMRVVWQSETDPYASRVLARHWPHVPNLGDVHRVDWSAAEAVDLVAGGYPCQPFSYAGARRGAGDPRHLWPEFVRCLRDIRPRWALLENVPGHLSLGFGRVLGDLAALGYDTEWDCIPAAHVGAPHLRYRVFVVAHTDGRGLEVRSQLDSQPPQSSAYGYPRRRHADGLRNEVADADHPGRSEQRGTLAGVKEVVAQLGDWWSVEPDVGRVADGVPARVDRLKCLGNAVVPQVAEHVGRLIMAADRW